MIAARRISPRTLSPAVPPHDRRVLCIEDNPEMAGLIAEDLRERGYIVGIVPDGYSGLQAIQNERPDLVLCDVDIPGIGGFELLESLTSAAPQLEAIRFIFLTASADRHSEMRARRLGANDYVTKPVDFEKLAAIIEAQFGNGPRHDALVRYVDLNLHELHCLTWSARGKTSREIARIMGFCKRTVDFHIDNAVRKLAASTRTEAVVKAVVGRLIDP